MWEVREDRRKHGGEDEGGETTWEGEAGERAGRAGSPGRSGEGSESPGGLLQVQGSGGVVHQVLLGSVGYQPYLGSSGSLSLAREL